MTLVGSILGTVGYMAPEQGLGEATTAATDQFSYGVTLYIALYGVPPFPSRELAEYLEHVHRPLPEPGDSKGVPVWIRRIVLRALSAEADDRYPSMEAMLAALRHDPTVLHRRLAIGACAVLLFAVGGLALGRSLHQRELVCAEDPAEFRAVWDDAARGRLKDAFGRSGVADARERAAKVAAMLTDFGGDWVRMRAAACRDTWVRKKQSEEVFRLRMDCLDRQLTEVRSIVAMLGSADSQVVRKSTEMAYGLPQLPWCEDVATLRASAGLPDDPMKRARVQAVRAKLAEVESNWLAGKVKVAEECATNAVSLARAIGHTPTTAEAVFVAGRGLQRAGDDEGAAPLLREATLLASRSGADSIVVRAAGELAALSLARGDFALANERGKIALARLVLAKSPTYLVPMVNVTAALA